MRIVLTMWREDMELDSLSNLELLTMRCNSQDSM